MEKKEAKVNGMNLPISTKISVEVCNFVRGKNITKAKSLLESVIKQKIPVPYKRYNQEMPHRKGKLANGRFPIKVCETILTNLKSAESNAKNLNLDSSLIVSHISAHKAPMQWHSGRQRRRRMKNTHIKIILTEEI